MKGPIWFLGLLFTIMMPAMAGADGLPVGSYEGTGSWRAMDGSTGEYKSRDVFEGEQITIEAKYDQGGTLRTEKHTMKLARKGAGFFELFSGKGESIGQLACLEGECTYGVKQDGLVVAESWRLDGGALQKFGSKKIGDFQVVWKETLYSN